jgi:hypothetical protein
MRKTKMDAQPRVISKTIYYSPFTIYPMKRGALHRRSSIHQNFHDPEVALLLARRLDVHVNLLRTSATKQTSSKRKEHYQNDDHEDHQNRDNARAAATTTITIVSHDGLLLL